MKQFNEHHTFTGMQRDLSISKHPAQFLTDALNIRLTARNEDTLFAITNEKGTADTSVTVQGSYLGHCLLNQYLVVFSTQAAHPPINPTDYITRIDLSTTTPTKKVIFSGELNFDTSHPIEAIGSYENESIQKVYWTDNYNQPRMVNIIGKTVNGTESFSYLYNGSFDFIRELQLNEEISIQKQLGAAGAFAPGVIQYAFTYYTKYGQESNIFYTSPLLYISYKDRGASPEDRVENAFKVSIRNLDTNFDYLRIYSIQRTSVNGTPIVRRVQDIAVSDISYTQENYVSSNTNPTILIGGTFVPITPYVDGIELVHDIDPLNTGTPGSWYKISKESFPNVQIRYDDSTVTWGEDATNNSIIWSSNAVIDGEYKICETASEEGSQETLSVESFISFLDTNTTGDTVDPTELLYKGGEKILVETIEQKDNTLFFGGLKMERPSLESIKTTIQGAVNIGTDRRTMYPTKVSESSYTYYNQLTSYDSTSPTKKSVPCGGFKFGDYYRLGVQFQYKDGRWSEPVFKGDFAMPQKPVVSGSSMLLPAFKGTLDDEVAAQLIGLGYKKVRPLVVFPDLYDRVVICQGVTNPTMYTENGTYHQSSWFFRPKLLSTVLDDDAGTVTPSYAETIPYTTRTVSGDNKYNATHIRTVEIQGQYDDANKFKLDSSYVTLHSPDIQFDDQLMYLDYEQVKYRILGKVNFINTMSDIDIQTESPTASDDAAGFIHKTFKRGMSYGIGAGLFYEDYVIDDDSDSYGTLTNMPYNQENSPVKWLVYPWQRTGSLNNDCERADGSTRTAVLKKKIISNLRYANTAWDNAIQATDIYGTPQIFSSNEVSILKYSYFDQGTEKTGVYQGNVDTLLSPDKYDGMYFAFNSSSITTPDVSTDFNNVVNWKTFIVTDGSGNGLYKANASWVWNLEDGNIGDKFRDLVAIKPGVRMKYKSTPHMFLNCTASTSPAGMQSLLPVVEIVRPGDNNNSYYRKTMFGGVSEDALKANTWIPCGEPVKLDDLTNIGTEQEPIYVVQFEYSYGDTYFQRWDCLKTYPFTPEDPNQIVEIGSFMLETHTNIDGRYDRNRGQLSNLHVTPQNFNLLNPVYSQIDNFFSYKIMDEDDYRLDSYPNQITWSKEKQAGADIDLWTNVTLASSYDMDGSKGAIVSLNTWKDQLFCFQEKGISNILFNSRVQIPTSDGNPIEISNNYKVDGYRLISDGIGCKNKFCIKETPAGIYFIDSVSNHLFSFGESSQDISQSLNMHSWFKGHKSIKRLTYDDIHHDLYLVNSWTELTSVDTDNKTLCYSETLKQFTSFFDYNNVLLTESYNGRVFTLKENNNSQIGNVQNTLWKMFEGDYNKFFGNIKPWYFTFVSNGLSDNTQDFDKIFANIDYRMDLKASDYEHNKSLDYIKAWNEYQDTRETSLEWQRVNSNLQKKFRIWRIQIPRAKKQVNGVWKATNDRIRNPWCKITLGKKNVSTTAVDNTLSAVLHDLNVQYYI